MMATAQCQRCGNELQMLRRPLSRLRWTRYWWRGVTSLFTGPLSICPQCGAMYTGDGELLAAGAVETDTEHRLDIYRRDMALLSDSFGGIIAAAGLLIVWFLVGAGSYDLGQLVAAASVGAASFAPFTYFARKARNAKRDLKQLRQARRSGQIPQPRTD